MLSGHGITTPNMTVWIRFDLDRRELRIGADLDRDPLDWEIACTWIDLALDQSGQLHCYEEYHAGIDVFIVKAAEGSALAQIMDILIAAKPARKTPPRRKLAAIAASVIAACMLIV